jgi:hypothetical protein
MPKPRTLRQLGGPCQSGGYAYALLYSTGVVQVGRTRDARAEVNARRGTARQLGITLTDWWVSEPVVEWVGGERHLAAAAREIGAREIGGGSFGGVDFAALCERAADMRGTEAPAPRAIAWTPDERMAVAVRYRAEGLTLRQSAERMLVSYGTVRRDLVRWDQVSHLMPVRIARLSVPVTQPRYIGPRDDTADVPDVTDVRNSPENVIQLRRPA